MSWSNRPARGTHPPETAMSFAPVVPLLALVGGAVGGATGFAAFKIQQVGRPHRDAFVSWGYTYNHLRSPLEFTETMWEIRPDFRK